MVRNITWRVPDMILEASGAVEVPVAIIDGPYDAGALSGVLARAPVSLGNANCSMDPNSACNHGTFIMGLLGARRDAPIPGLCPGCRLLHVPLFVDADRPWASISDLANAITIAVAAGARLINLSLAILGEEAENHGELATALDHAEASGAVVMVAAGNQGRLAIGQLLSHPVTVPVVAVDAARRLLPDSNFGPTISGRGVAAFGHEVLGYAPGGGTTAMSGTSVATAVAAATLAQLWSARPEADGAAVRTAVARLIPRDGPIPPMLYRDIFLATLDQVDVVTVAGRSRGRSGTVNYARLQGETTMKGGNGQPVPLGRSTGPAATSGHVVTPAHGSGGCACGAPGGICTCANGESSPSHFIYVLGSVDIRFPDQSISEELATVARTLGIHQGKDEPLRSWYYKVLSHTTEGVLQARYVARQLSWILTVEGHPAYYLALRDWHDLPDLVSCLGRTEDDLDLVVGSSSLIPAEISPGVTAPVLAVDHLSAFTKSDLLKWIKPSKTALEPPSKAKAKAPRSKVSDLFDKLVQSADNLGDTDEWRALNYLAVNYQPLYEQYAVMVRDGWTLDGVKVMTSRISREKHIVDPVIAFRQIETGLVQRYFVRVDVSHLFPMIANQIAEYFDR
jgi:hypothetical protein